MREYYDTRAPEYDDWYLGRGLFAERDRRRWRVELDRIIEVIAALPPGRTLDVACGTGFLTRHLQGDVVGIDQSERMLDQARVQAPRATYVQGDAFALPFANDMFDRVFTGHFYGHLQPDEREVFLREAQRVARELVVVDASRAHSDVDEHMSQRVLNDGSTWEVFKRYFRADELVAELGNGEVLFQGEWFVVVCSPL